MMSMMMAVRVLGVHIAWQYTNLNAIWQALKDLARGLSQSHFMSP
jgi:hypothetical protein